MGQDPQHAAPVASIPADSTESVILKIRKEYARINSDSAKYRVVHIEVLGESSEGGDILRYFDGKHLIKAVATSFGAGGNQITEYYYRDGKLFFCYDRLTMYNGPMESYTHSKIAEDRYYLDNLKLIRWVKPNGKIADKKLYPEKQKELAKEVIYVRTRKSDLP